MNSTAAFRKQAAERLEAYAAQHGAKPEAICLPNLGIVIARDDAPGDTRPLHNKVAVVTARPAPSATASARRCCKGARAWP